MKKEIKNLEFKNYYLREFQLYDGECDITFNIVAIDTSKEEITVAVTNRGRIMRNSLHISRSKELQITVT